MVTVDKSPSPSFTKTKSALKVAMLKQLLAWTVVILAISGIAGGLYLIKSKELRDASSQAAAFPEKAEAVASAPARTGEWSSTARAIGNVVALRQLEVKNEIAGIVVEVGFKSGDIVEKGQLLVQFDTRQETAGLEAAQSDTRLAKLTLERRESLEGSAAFSRQEYDRAREEFAAAKARARNLEVIVDKKRITAPFRARVGITDLQPGAYLDVGTSIVFLQGTADDAFVDFTLPQDNAIAIGPNSTATLSGPSLPSGSATAKIAAEDNSADASNRAVRFRAVAAHLGDKLRPGTFLDVTAVTSAPKPTVLVPISAVRRSTGGQFVFVLVNEQGKLRARQRAVETAAIIGSDIAITKGIAAGELVATSGSFKLRDGVLVSTDQPEAAGQVSIN